MYIFFKLRSRWLFVHLEKLILLMWYVFYWADSRPYTGVFEELERGRERGRGGSGSFVVWKSLEKYFFKVSSCVNIIASASNYVETNVVISF